MWVPVGPSQAATCGQLYEGKSHQASYYVCFLPSLLLSLLFQVIFVLIWHFLSFSDKHQQMRETILTASRVLLLMDEVLKRMCEMH